MALERDPFLNVIGALYTDLLGYQVEVVLDHGAKSRWIKVTSGEHVDVAEISAREWFNLHSQDEDLVRRTAQAIADRADEIAVVLLERRARTMRRVVRTTKRILETELDKFAISLNDFTGIAYFRHWCPNCEVSSKEYRPKPRICRDQHWGEHPPTAMRITPVFVEDQR